MVGPWPYLLIQSCLRHGGSDAGRSLLRKVTCSRVVLVCHNQRIYAVCHVSWPNLRFGDGAKESIVYSRPPLWFLLTILQRRLHRASPVGKVSDTRGAARLPGDGVVTVLVSGDLVVPERVRDGRVWSLVEVRLQLLLARKWVESLCQVTLQRCVWYVLARWVCFAAMNTLIDRRRAWAACLVMLPVLAPRAGCKGPSQQAQRRIEVRAPDCTTSPSCGACGAACPPVAAATAG